MDVDNTYSPVGFVFTGGLGSVVALDTYWVLTAAHVVDAGALFLVMGDPNTDAEGIFLPDQVIVHPDYVPGEFHDDLALINLALITPIIPVPGVVDASFAMLSNVALHGGLPVTATLTGYGLTQVDGTVDLGDPMLRRIGVAATDPVGPTPPPLFDPGFPFDCSQPMLLCTYGTSGGAPGDSGGAMWLDYGGGPVVAAIMSFVFDENDLRDPPETPDWNDGYWTVGTSVAYYQDWIRSHVPDVQFGSAPVPVPAAFWLFGSALLALGAIRHRK
ncbi:MAG: trypsin-like serine protease [Gammaproteobacteria bacterium]